MTSTPDFTRWKLWQRLLWAGENLKPVHSKYRVVYEESIDECAGVLVPDPNWMACALHGNILPPVWVYWILKKDEAKPDFVEHTNGYLLHETKPVAPMTEEQAIEYLIQKDIPQNVWQNWNEGNKPKLVICSEEQIPTNRDWRDAWRLADRLAA